MELAKAYEPKSVEERWYASWLHAGCFKPRGAGKPYSITIPPPNITGSLHIGHALNNTILDTYTRWHRMQGDNALCLPGTDHAGIATQNVVERELGKDGVSRHDIGREKFIERCWEWRKQYGDRIYLQFQKLGCSYDWDRARFTMDESYVEAIYEEFLRWWDRGLIYRGARVVNWCPRCMSAISDIEVNSEDRAGNLYYFRYPFSDGSGFVTIATTRPETMLGDAAVAVNPADERYAGLIGKMIDLPLTGRAIPLIADDYAKMEFGTGAVKVTPAHDLDDFECGQRNNLPQIVVIGEDGCMTAEAGSAFAGLDRFECRQQIILQLEREGLLDKVEPYALKAPLCDRCKTILEPLLSEQWFVNMKPLAEPAIAAVRDGRIRIVPERYTRIYLDWMENIRDWCISRQLWWGHRIPVWWTEDGRYSAGRSAEDAAQRLGVPADALRQDEDVLDTWFSSALWPHATLGWPRDTDDLKTWYPTNLLSTAQEILYLWVARMIMTGLDFIGEIPFHDVYIHATVLDEKGDRMSKSKGNGVDPLDMVEAYGADALRFSLLQQAGMNQDIKFSADRVRIAGQFCNKLWNASRFVMMNLSDASGTPLDLSAGPEPPTPGEAGLTTPDRWILSRLHRTIETVNASLATYNMDDAMRAIYQFLWDDFCDWYVEIAKPRLRDEDGRRTAQRVLYHTLETTLRLMHPMVPHITEEIWQTLRATVNAGGHTNPDEQIASQDSVMVASYPAADPAFYNEQAEGSVALLIDAIRAMRNLRAELGLPPSSKQPGAVVATSAAARAAFEANSAMMPPLARLTDLRLLDAPPSGEGKWVGTPVTGAEVFLEIGEALDVPKELERIAKELATLEADLAKSRAKLLNPQFTDKAPAAIVEKERAYAASMEEKHAKLTARRGMLQG